MTAWYNHQAGVDINWSWEFIKRNPEYCIVFSTETEGITEDKHKTAEFAKEVAKAAAHEAAFLAAEVAAQAALQAAATLAAKVAAKAALVQAVHGGAFVATKFAASMAAKHGASLVAANLATAWCPPLLLVVNAGFVVWTVFRVDRIANDFAPDCTSYGKDTCLTKAFKGNAPRLHAPLFWFSRRRARRVLLRVVCI